jgi:hypothetical protein
MVGAILSLLMVVVASCIFFLWCPAFLRKKKIKQKCKHGELCSDLHKLI